MNGSLKNLGSLFNLPARPFSNHHPVFFASIVIYRSRAWPIQAIAAIPPGARNPVVLSALNVIVIGFEAVDLQTSERPSGVIEALSRF